MAVVAADAEANAAAAAPPSSAARHSSSAPRLCSSASRLGLLLREYTQPRGYEPSGSRSKVVDGWMAGVTAPVPGSTRVPAWTATVSIRISDTSPDLLPRGIVQRLPADDGGDGLAEELDGQARAGRGRGDRDVAVRDRRADRVAVAAARHPADRTPIVQDRLAAEGNHRRVGQGEAGELARQPFGFLPDECLAADEITLVEPDAEAQPGLERRVLGRDLGAPVAVALLEPERIDCPVAAGAQAGRGARSPERVPERQTGRRLRVELPAQLADVGHSQGEDAGVAHRDAARAHVGKRHVRDVVSRRPGENLARSRPEETETGIAIRDVLDRDRARVGRVRTDPREIVQAERAAGDEHVAIRGQARDGQVALDPAALVQELGVGDRADRVVEVVVGQPLQEAERPGA